MPGGDGGGCGEGGRRGRGVGPVRARRYPPPTSTSNSRASRARAYAGSAASRNSIELGRRGPHDGERCVANFLKKYNSTEILLAIPKNCFIMSPCSGGGTGETGSTPFRMRDDRQARRGRKFSSGERKAENQTDRARTRDFARSGEYWKDAQPTRNPRTDRTQNPHSSPRALLGAIGGFVLCGYLSRFPRSRLTVFVKTVVESVWTKSGKHRKCRLTSMNVGEPRKGCRLSPPVGIILTA